MYQINIDCDGQITAYMAAEIIKMVATYCHIEEFGFNRRYDLSITVDRIDKDLLSTISNLFPIGINDMTIFDAAGYIRLIEELY